MGSTAGRNKLIRRVARILVSPWFVALLVLPLAGVGCGSCEDRHAPGVEPPDSESEASAEPSYAPEAASPPPFRQTVPDREVASESEATAPQLDPVEIWRRLTDRRETVREDALDELAIDRSPEGVAILEDFLLREGDTALRLRAVEVLELREPGRAAQALGRGLNDPDPEVRMASAEALEALGTPEATRALWTAVERERDSDVRESLLDALDSLGQNVERHRD